MRSNKPHSFATESSSGQGSTRTSQRNQQGKLSTLPTCPRPKEALGDRIAGTGHPTSSARFDWSRVGLTSHSSALSTRCGICQAGLDVLLAGDVGCWLTAAAALQGKQDSLLELAL